MHLYHDWECQDSVEDSAGFTSQLGNLLPQTQVQSVSMKCFLQKISPHVSYLPVKKKLLLLAAKMTMRGLIMRAVSSKVFYYIGLACIITMKF